MKLKVQRDKGVEPRMFRVGGKKHYKVKLALEATPDELKDIVRVEYKLHPSFKDPVRVGRDKDKKFAQEIWTYGYFPVEVRVEREGNVVDTFTDMLKFD